MLYNTKQITHNNLLSYKQLYMFYRELHLWIYRIIEKL